jgi:hypothetical protein
VAIFEKVLFGLYPEIPEKKFGILSRLASIISSQIVTF